MMKRVIILGIIVYSIVVASALTVTAADQLSCTDDENDFIDYLGQPISGSYTDIDIKEVLCTKTGGKVELILELVDNGEIQNSALYLYSITLDTDKEQYMALYQAGECEVTDSEYNIIEDIDWSVEDNEFQVSFDLLDSDEDCSLIAGTTMYIEGDDAVIDICPNEDFTVLEVDIVSPDTGKTGKSIQFSGSGEGDTSDYEWYWDFGDGETSEEQNPTHTYDTPDTYEVYLIVTDGINIGEAYATITITANGGDNGSDDSSGLTMFIALIVIIVIAGVAVLVYVIRR